MTAPSRDDLAVPPPARTALVTGASRGIGRNIALGLARAGLDVALLARTADALAEVADLVEAEGVRSLRLAADVTNLPGVEAAVARAVTEFGHIDVLVNDAGRIESVEVPAWEADPDEWWAVVETNMRGAFHLVRSVVPGMLSRGGGRVVHLSTGSATRDNDVYSAYYASKTGMLRFGSGLHEAGYERGLRAFEIAPGVVRTDMTSSMAVHDGRDEWTDPQDVVELVVAAASGELDAWSGCYLRAGADDLDTLRTVGARAVPAEARRLRVRPWGDDDRTV